MVYANSCEEHRYLAAIRKEKETFERLVKERGVCPIPLNNLDVWLLTFVS
jgi:DNA excision repair protein ERCC-4